MNVRISETKEKTEKPFPKLMLGTEGKRLVLFTEAGVGTQLNTFGLDSNGYHFNKWVMTHFEEFEGEITLSND